MTRPQSNQSQLNRPQLTQLRPEARQATPEAYSYTLTLGGRYAGTQDWVIRSDRGNTVARVQTEFGGALPAGRKVQESRLSADSGFSMAYAEAEGGNKRPHFETIFDERTGMVTLKQGKDEASMPLLEGHHDPLSLLLWLREHAAGTAAPERSGPAETPSGPGATPSGPGTTSAEPETHAAPPGTPISVRLVGGRVHVQPLPDSQVGGLPAWVYFLRPGGAYVYVEQAPPHRLLRLIQPSDFGPVEASLSLGGSAGEGQQGGQRAGERPGHQRDPARPGRSQSGKPRRRK